MLLLTGCFRAPLIRPQQPRERVTLFAGVRVFDGRGDTLSEPTDVLVRDGRVTAIAPSIKPPDGAALVRGEGLTLLPGLFDGHVHLGGVEGEPVWDIGSHLPDVEAQSAALLYCGITTAVLAGRDGDSEDLARDITARRLAGPRLLTATRILTARGGHPVGMFSAGLPAIVRGVIISRTIAQVQGEEAARKMVRDELSSGAHHLKIVYHAMPEDAPRLTREELVAAISEAKALGKPAVVHVGTAQGAVEAAQAGATMLMHIPWEDDLTPEQARAIKEAGTAVVTTTRIYAAMLSSLSGAPQFTKLEREVMRPGLEKVFADKPAVVPLPGFEDYVGRSADFDAHLRKNVVTLREAAVTLVAGTDTGIPAVFPGAALHEELKYVAAQGIPASEVLRMATSNAAGVMDPKGGRGVIEVGSVADLLLVRGDPTQDLAALDEIAGVWKRGERQR